MASARRPVSAFSIAFALTALSAITSRRFFAAYGGGYTGLNIKVVLIGPSGAGKEYPQEQTRRLLRSVDMSARVASIASDIALRRQLTNDPVLFLTQDEYGSLLLRVSRSRSGSDPVVNIQTLLMTLFSRSTGMLEPHTYADAKKTLKAVDAPHVVVMSASTYSKMEEAMSGNDIMSGHTNRDLWFVTQRGVAPQHERADPAFGNDITDLCNILAGNEFMAWCDQKLAPTFAELQDVERVTVVESALGSALNEGQPVSGYPVKFTDEAAKILRSFENDFVEPKIQSDNELSGHTWARSVEYTIKIAALLAIGDWACALDQRPLSPPLVGIKNVSQAITLVKWSVEEQFAAIADDIADKDLLNAGADMSKLQNRVLSHIRLLTGENATRAWRKGIKNNAYFDLNSQGWAADTQINYKLRRYSKQIPDTISALKSAGMIDMERSTVTTGRGDKEHAFYRLL
jgi:hypothetical protein